MKLPPIRKILVPMDLSRAESGLMDYAIELGRQTGGEILFFTVIDSPTALYLIKSHPSEAGTGDEGFRTKLVNDAKVLLKRMVDRAAEKEVRAMGHAVVSEKPEAEVLREAGEREVDLILFGSVEHSVLYRLILGDATEAILQRSPCPVLVVRTKGEG